MSSTTPSVVATDSRQIVIEGLEKAQGAEQFGSKRNVEGQSDSPTFSTVMHEDEPLSELWKRIKDYGFREPIGLLRDENSFSVYSNWVIADHDEVIVVAADQVSTNNTIKISERLISHANTHYGQPIEFSMSHMASTQLNIESNCGLHISFERTPRMPDDDKLHQLPGSLGSYDLFSVEAYEDRLPIPIREAGGLFFPMWQREAMWINFGVKSLNRYAVRVFMGHVNVVSGLTIEEAADGDHNAEEGQDYVVVPGQRWLDGICVAPGVVRQFVAMPLGSGYTVEGQKTSKEKHGGLQIEITPDLLQKQRSWTHASHQFVDVSVDFYTDNNTLDENKTPAQLGCKIGDILRSFPVNDASREPFSIKHLVGSDRTITMSAINPVPLSAAGGRDLSPLLAYSDPCPAAGFSFPFDEFMGSLEQHNLVDPGLQQSFVDPTMQQDFPVPLMQPDLVDPLMKQSPSQCSDGTANGKGLEAGLDNLKITESEHIKAMGLAAGGKLIQDIYEDPYPATIWNHAAARILHVHILDPVSCEKVTHIIPTPPTTDVKAYTEAGGQYFVVEEKVDERLDGGDFDNVKSVSQMDQRVGISTEPEFDPTKPKMCTTCELRLCDCIVRPCDHQFCNICIRRIEQNSEEDPASARRNWKCPTCDTTVSHVAGFSAPMNLPGEEPLRIKVPVNVLTIEDGRVRFSSVQKTRV